MANSKTYLKKGDKVKVVAGKEKGKIGNIVQVLRDKEAVLIERVNMVKRHQRPGGMTRQGGIVEKEAPLHWSNVMIMCDKCVKPVRVHKRILDNGDKVRVCSNCGELIDT
ncbi:MAG: 50S ribosomal protein L24 [Desulfatibacillaceae bacterium]